MILINFPFFFFFIDFSRQIEASLFAEYHYFHWFVLTFFSFSYQFNPGLIPGNSGLIPGNSGLM